MQQVYIQTLSGQQLLASLISINYGLLSLSFLSTLTFHIIDCVSSMVLLLLLSLLSTFLGVLLLPLLHLLPLLLFSPRCLPGSSLVLQVLKDLSEEVRVNVDSQHVATQPLDQLQSSFPECITTGLYQERFEGVGDLIAQVGVAQVQTGEEGGMELLL